MRLLIGMFLTLLFQNVYAGECSSMHPEWIFCDDFESQDPLVKPGRYFEYNSNNGEFIVVDGVGYGGSRGMQVHWQKGEINAGDLKLAFGDNPHPYMNQKGRAPRWGEPFREIFYRMYVMMKPPWQGNPKKLSRTTVFVSSNNWGQAMIAHLWGMGNYYLGIDPVTCVKDGVVPCQKYNDFGKFRWLGARKGVTPIFDTLEAGVWQCIEHHVKLNDPGVANGIQEFWINGYPEASRYDLDFVGTYTTRTLNAIFFENYWNNGSPQDQYRYIDNLVVSTGPIGCI